MTGFLTIFIFNYFCKLFPIFLLNLINIFHHISVLCTVNSTWSYFQYICLITKIIMVFSNHVRFNPYKNLLIKRQYGSIYRAFFENFDQKTTRFNPYCLLRKFWSRDNSIHSITAFLENFDQKTIRFKPYCPYWKFWKKRQYGSTDIVFLQNFDQKEIRFNPI